jgi:arylsulfatase A-like enzyme
MASQTDADHHIGRLVAALEQHSISESTIVALSTDNGPEERAIFVNGAGNTGPFRGQKVRATIVELPVVSCEANFV